MSCHERYNLDLSLGKAQAANLRRKLVDFQKTRHSFLYELALRCWEAAVRAKETKAEVKWGEAETGASVAAMLERTAIVWQERAFVVSKLYPKDRDYRLQKPLKKDFVYKPEVCGTGKHRFTASQRDCWDCWEIYVEEGRSPALCFEVPENNHAVDDAMEHPLVKRLFELLHDEKWRGETGGVGIYRCEYGEWPEIRHRYGKLGKEYRPPYYL